MASPATGAAELPVRLVADAMLGRLARWLRSLGYDTLYDTAWDDAALARLARAEGRLLLTRDRQLAARRGLRSLLVASDYVVEQLEQVLAVLPRTDAASLGRCRACNGLLEEVDRTSVERRVPEYVWENHSDFALCRGCGRIYWQGAQYTRLRERLLLSRKREGE
jgi:uncharacterized protein with PIN domain